MQRLLIVMLLLVGLGLASGFTQTRADDPARPKPEAVPQTGHTSAVNDVAFSPDGRWLATGTWRRTVLLEAATGHEVRTLAGHTGSVNGVAFRVCVKTAFASHV